MSDVQALYIISAYLQTMDRHSVLLILMFRDNSQQTMITLYQLIGNWIDITSIAFFRVDRTVTQDTVDRTVTLEHSRWDSYIKTQQIGQLHQDTVLGTVTLGHSRLDSYIRTQYIGQLLQDTLDQTVLIGYSRLDGYI